MAKKHKHHAHPQVPPEPEDRTLHESLVHEFIDASVLDQDKARDKLKRTASLLKARYVLGETPLRFLAIENYLGGVRFLG